MAKKKFKLTTSTAAIIAIVVIVFVIFFSTQGQTAQFFAPGGKTQLQQTTTTTQPTISGGTCTIPGPSCPKGSYCDTSQGSGGQGVCKNAPDLIVSSISLSTQTPKAGDTVNYTFVAKNSGTSTADQGGAIGGVNYCSVWYRTGDVTGLSGGHELPPAYVTDSGGIHDALKPGQSTTSQTLYFGTSITGKYVVKICEDAMGPSSGLGVSCNPVTDGKIKELDDSAASNCKWSTTVTFS